MRTQLLKLKKCNSTKYERRFAELLKANHIKFKTKVKINGREVDFLIRNKAIDINGHDQDTNKNEMLVMGGFVPIHFHNSEIAKLNIKKICQ